MAELVPAPAPRAGREELRPQLHGRCRGGGPAGALPRRDRRVLGDPSLAGWDGFGLAVQAYQKRCIPVIDHVADLAARLDRRLMVRLVKGAYWDTEVKRAQERGLPDFPVFTRKSMTDLSYLAAAERMLATGRGSSRNSPPITRSPSRPSSSGRAGIRNVRVPAPARHGRGALRPLLASVPGAACRTYAPVGGHRDLLAYLVRRLLRERRQLVLRLAGRRPGGAGGEPAAPPGRERGQPGPRPARQAPSPRRPVCARAGQFRRGRVRRPGGPGAPDGRGRRRPRTGRGRAGDRRRRPGRHAARRREPERSQPDRRHRRRGLAEIAAAAMRAARKGAAAGARSRRSSAPPPWTGPPTRWRPPAAG